MSWTSQQTRSQYAAIIRLRWRIFLNGFRRKESAASVVVWILVLPFAAFITLGLMFGAGAASAAFTEAGHIERVAWVFWGIFVVTQLVNIQLGQPGTTFDPTQLIRFPMTAGHYTAIRLFFGLLSPSNIIVTLLSFAAVAGILIIRADLWLYAIAAAIAFALLNALFSRMIFSWIDRWLSTRRAREVFTAIIFIGSLGLQWANFTYNPGYNHHYHHHHRASQNPDSDETADSDTSSDATAAKLQHAQALYAKAQPWLAILPPDLTADTIDSAAKHRPAKVAIDLTADLLYAAAFFAIFAMRMRTEFRGENLSDQANAVSKKDPAKTKASAKPAHDLPARAQPQSIATNPSRNIVSAIVAKEFLYLRRNTGLFYGLIAPLVMVFLFAGKFAARGSGSSWLFPCALAYALLGVVPVSFNSFGLDGIGSQVYFMTPIRMRDVLLGKNILNSLLAVVEIAAVLALVIYLSGMPPLTIVLSAILWAAGTLFIELTVGNYRSIAAPKRIDPGRTAQKQARPLSAFASMGILLAAAGVGWSLMMLAQLFPNLSWILPLCMLVFAAVAAAIYWHNLNAMDSYAMRHRESLFEELSRKA
jgi:ABC-2 type transport system permease protein